MRAIIRRVLAPNSIRTSTVLAFMALIFTIVLCLSLASYNYSINDFETLSINYTSQLIGEINARIDAYINNMKSMATVVVENDDVRRLMSYYNRYHTVELDALQREEQERLLGRAVNHMNIVANTRSDITNIAVISKYRDVVLSDSNKKFNVYSSYNITDWFLRPLSYKDEIFVSPSHVQTLIQDEYKWVISISKAILDPETNEVTGTMVIDMNYRAIEEICENVNLEQTGYIYLMDPKKNLIYHPQQQLIYSGIKSEDFDKVMAMGEDQAYIRVDGGKKILLRNKSPITGWIAVGVINSQNLIANRPAIISFYIWLAYIAIVLAAVCAIIISTGITKPIKQLEQTMHRVETGDLSVRSEINLKNEIGHLSRTFNGMVERISNLMQSIIQREEEKRKSEIIALQAQINPHFLYNTLDTIIWMSASGKKDDVVEVTSALAHLFRTSISQGDSLVELRVEIQNIESYLTIQKMRYKDKLTYSINVPEGLYHLMAPKLILQPIVENALYHGIKQSQDGGYIAIGAARCGEHLVITVEDSGIGMSPEQMEDLFRPKEKDSRAIGVQNVHNRIRLVFGDEFGLGFESELGTGTKVTIRMPAVIKDDVIEINGKEDAP